MSSLENTMKGFTFYVSNNIGRTPARVHRPSKTIFLNKKLWFRLPLAYRKIILFHEAGHANLDTKNEVEADRYSFEHFAGSEPLSLKNTIKVLSKFLDPNNPGHQKRLHEAYKRALAYDAEHFGNQKAAELLAQIEKEEKNGTESFDGDPYSDEFIGQIESLIGEEFAGDTEPLTGDEFAGETEPLTGDEFAGETESLTGEEYAGDDFSGRKAVSKLLEIYHKNKNVIRASIAGAIVGAGVAYAKKHGLHPKLGIKTIHRRLKDKKITFREVLQFNAAEGLPEEYSDWSFFKKVFQKTREITNRIGRATGVQKILDKVNNAVPVLQKIADKIGDKAESAVIKVAETYVKNFPFGSAALQGVEAIGGLIDKDKPKEQVVEAAADTAALAQADADKEKMRLQIEADKKAADAKNELERATIQAQADAQKLSVQRAADKMGDAAFKLAQAGTKSQGLTRGLPAQDAPQSPQAQAQGATRDVPVNTTATNTNPGTGATSQTPTDGMPDPKANANTATGKGKPLTGFNKFLGKIGLKRDYNEDGTEKKKSYAWIYIAIGIAAVGAAIFFIVKHNKEN